MRHAGSFDCATKPPVAKALQFLIKFLDGPPSNGISLPETSLTKNGRSELNRIADRIAAYNFTSVDWNRQLQREFKDISRFRIETYHANSCRV
jgi:hypothetical protein